LICTDKSRCQSLSLGEKNNGGMFQTAHSLAQSLLCFCFEQRRLADAMEAHDSHEIAEHHANDVVVTGAVDHCCNTSSEEKRGEYESAHGLGGLLVCQLRPDACIGLLAQHLPRDFAVAGDFSGESVGRVHVSAPSEALVQILNIDAGKGGKALTVFGCKWLEHSPILAIRYRFDKRFAKYDKKLPARTPIMETKGDRRRRKLIELADTVDGGLPAIADRANCSVASLQQLIDVTLMPIKKDGTRSRKLMGDLTAERIEDALNYPRGWFDTDAPTKDQAPVNELHDALLLIAAYGKSVTELRRDDVARKLSELFLQPDRFNEYADDILRWLNPPMRAKTAVADTSSSGNKTVEWKTPEGLATHGDDLHISDTGEKRR
jgi:hypothetical protein